jgi:3-methyladenine DNA glycosylase/8-oxoguanine DNA glycosylase
MPFPWLYDLAAGAVLQQRVDFAEACRSWRAIVERMGGGVSLPAASELARQPLWRFSELRIDGQRARTLLALAKEEAFARFLHLGTPRDLLLRRLGRLPGIGPWTLGMLTGFGLGDPDALILGDLHLPRIVCELLAPDAPVSEARMVEALEPFAGQRFRVSRLLVSHAIAERRRRG